MKATPIFTCVMLLSIMNCIILAFYYYQSKFNKDLRFLDENSKAHDSNKCFEEQKGHIEKSIIDEEQDKQLNLLVFGDFGFMDKQGEPAPSTKELGNFIYNKVKNSSLTYDFIVSVGDMVYPYGIRSNKDPKINAIFEKTFKIQQLGLNWYSVLGNHDYIGNLQATFGLAKKFYPFWQQREPYYYKVFQIGTSDSKAAFIFLDSCELACLKPDSPECFRKTRRNIKFDKIQDQIVWLEDVLSKLVNDQRITWKIVVIHSGIFSAGIKHGDNAEIKAAILPLLTKYKVDLVLSGHDHNVQYLRMDLDFNNGGFLSKIKQAANNQGFSLKDNKLDKQEDYDPNVMCWKKFNKDECLIREFFEEEITRCQDLAKENRKLPKRFDFQRESNANQHEHLHQIILGNGSNRKHQICPLEQQKSEGKLKYGNHGLGISEIIIREDNIEIKLISAKNETLYKVKIQKQNN